MDYLKPMRPFEITLGVREPWAEAGMLWSYMPKEAADGLAQAILAQESGQAHHEGDLDPLGRNLRSHRPGLGRNRADDRTPPNGRSRRRTDDRPRCRRPRTFSSLLPLDY